MFDLTLTLIWLIAGTIIFTIPVVQITPVKADCGNSAYAKFNPYTIIAGSSTEFDTSNIFYTCGIPGVGGVEIDFEYDIWVNDNLEKPWLISTNLQYPPSSNSWDIIYLNDDYYWHYKECEHLFLPPSSIYRYLNVGTSGYMPGSYYSYAGEANYDWTCSIIWGNVATGVLYVRG
ncbi:MAG: hypothetical protein ACPL1B_01105 [Thermoprotei archaeon]